MSDDPADWCWIRTYWCQPGARPLPFFHAFDSPVYADLGRTEWTGPRVHLRGAVHASSAVSPCPGQDYIGSPDLWANGVPLSLRQDAPVGPTCDAELWDSGITVGVDTGPCLCSDPDPAGYPATLYLNVFPDSPFPGSGLPGNIPLGGGGISQFWEHTGPGAPSYSSNIVLACGPDGERLQCELFAGWDFNFLRFADNYTLAVLDTDTGACCVPFSYRARATVTALLTGTVTDVNVTITVTTGRLNVETSSGGDVDGGAAVMTAGYHLTGRGGNVDGGTALMGHGTSQTGSGGDVDGGEASFGHGKSMVGAGGDVDGGEATITAAAFWTGSGGNVDGGNADFAP